MEALRKLAWCTILVVPLLISGCGGSDTDNETETTDSSPNVNGTPSLSKVYTYQSSSLSDKVLSCSKLFLDSDSCSVSDIKPIGVDATGNVSLDDIKSRLVVSHDWMADSFIAALEEINDQDLLNLFKPLNTIVLSYDIRPAFYHGLTASIYMDPRYLWRNSIEWETIYAQDDYRDAFVTEFSFDSFGRYVDANSNEYINWSNAFKADTYSNRTSVQVAPGLFRLLSHELAHANDYLPQEILSSISDSGRIYHDYINTNNNIHDELTESIPLNSTLLHEAAQIAFKGMEMSDLIRGTSASEAGNAFDADGAAAMYSYSSEAEDVAMLFEGFMMYKEYGAVRDVAYVTIPTADESTCDDYIVKWGQRNRMADSAVKKRAILAGSRLLTRDISPDLSSISDAPIEMAADIGWCASQHSTIAARGGQLNSRQAEVDEQVIHDYRDDKIRPHLPAY